MDGWKIVWSSWNTQDIYMAKNYLEANGIECVLQDELTTQTSYYANAIGGAKLLVREEEVREAARLLVEGGYIDEEDCDPGEEVVNVEETARTDKNRCPFCGSGNIGISVVPKALQVLRLRKDVEVCERVRERVSRKIRGTDACRMWRRGMLADAWRAMKINIGRECLFFR